MPRLVAMAHRVERVRGEWVRVEWVRVSAGLLLALLTTGHPAGAQSAPISATATVRGRPLMLRGIDLVTPRVPQLRLRYDGCGAGTLSLRRVGTSGQQRQLARLPVGAGDSCGLREVTIPLSAADAQDADLIVTLEQSSALLAPSIAEVVVPASVRRARPRSSVTLE